MNMNKEQIEGILRVMVPWLSALGILHLAPSQADTVINNLTIILYALSTIIAAGMTLWSILAHTDTAKVKAVETVPDVKAVDLKPTPTGKAIADVTGPKVQVKP